MQIAYTPEQEALRQELRGVLRRADDARGRGRGARAGETGGPGVPRGRAPDGPRRLARHRLARGVRRPGPRPTSSSSSSSNEAWRAGAPMPFLTINTVGQTIMEFGSEEQKDVLPAEDPRRRAATSRSATPSPTPAPTSRRSRTKAVKDGDEWVINGQKIYTSLAQLRRLHLAGGPHRPRRAEAPGHHDLPGARRPTPGFSYSKIHTMVNASARSTRSTTTCGCGDDAIIGELNRGWDLIINQLNYERVSLAPPGMVERCYEDVVAWAQETKLPDGRRVIDQEWVQLNLARVHGRARVPEAHQLEGAADRRRSTRPTPARPRCSAPSSSPRPTGC